MARTLDQYLKYGDGLRKGGNSLLILQYFKLGADLFPGHRDPYGDQYFSKEYIRNLLQLNNISAALREYYKSESPGILILFIRYWMKHKKYSQATLGCLRYLQMSPGHQECSQILLKLKSLGSQEPISQNTEDIRLAIDLIPDKHERFEYYMGNYYSTQDKKSIALKFVEVYLESPNLKIEVKNCLYDISTLESSGVSSGLLGRNYQLSLLENIKKYNLDVNKFALVIGDLPSDHPSIPFPFLTKTRSHSAPQFGTILRLMNENRHWELFRKISFSNLTPFDRRKDALVWRGATTGFHRNKSSRFALVQKYFDYSEKIDIGFSSIVQAADDCSKYLKDKLSFHEMCEYKYILSVSGNDKDSGLNWKLASGSVVIMPRPKSYSWLGEKFLIPGYHYLELSDDFSDLPELIDWCSNNQSECQKIAYNAQVYMSQFLDEEGEQELQKEVLSAFFSSFEFGG